MGMRMVERMQELELHTKASERRTEKRDGGTKGVSRGERVGLRETEVS